VHKDWTIFKDNWQLEHVTRGWAWRATEAWTTATLKQRKH